MAASEAVMLVREEEVAAEQPATAARAKIRQEHAHQELEAQEHRSAAEMEAMVNVVELEALAVPRAAVAVELMRVKQEE